MGLAVIWLSLARNKLQGIYKYHKLEAGERIAQKIVNGIVDETLGLETHPEIGKVEILLDHRRLEYRYVVYTNYKIIYSVDRKSSRIKIANIFDVRQNPNKINETK